MRKKLFTIIMSVMMVAVFMPSMAFATSAPEPTEPEYVAHEYAHEALAKGGFVLEQKAFSADFSSWSAVITCGYKDDVNHKYCNKTWGPITVPTTRVFDTATGLITATVDKDDIKEAMVARLGVQNTENIAPAEYASDVTTTYYDLTGAKLVFANVTTEGMNADTYMRNVTAAVPATATAEAVPAKFSKEVAWPRLVEPSYTEAAKAAKATGGTYTPQEAVVNGDAFDVEVYAADYDAYDEGSFAVPFTVTKKKANTTSVIGQANPSTDLKIFVDANSTLNYVGLYADGVLVKYLGEYSEEPSEEPSVSFPYTGKAHKVELKAKNVVAKYAKGSIQQAAKDKLVYSEAPVEVTNYADATDVSYKLAFNKEFKVYSAAKEGVFHVSVDKAPVTFAQKQFNVTVGEHYDVQFEDFMTVSGVVPAEYAQFVELLDTYCVTAKPAMVGSGNVYFDEANLAATTGKLASEIAFLSNYTIVDNGQETLAVTVQETKDNVFTQVYKGVNAKKGVKKTVQLKTKGAKGAVTWKKLSGTSKVTVSADGKLVVKKGLKKGTYKVKVKATAAGDYLYGEGSVTKVLKVKVK